MIAMSAGNHAQAVAYQAARLRIPATIVMPENTPFTRVRRTQAFGARIILSGENLADEGLTVVPPYDDERIIAGQGTCGLELLRDVPDLDVVLVPIGGGGNHCGHRDRSQGRRGRKSRSSACRPNCIRHTIRSATDCPRTAVKRSRRASRSNRSAPFHLRSRPDSSTMWCSFQSNPSKRPSICSSKRKARRRGRGRRAGCGVIRSARAVRRAVTSAWSSAAETSIRAYSPTSSRGSVCAKDASCACAWKSWTGRGVLADVARLIGESGANILDVTHQRLFADVPSRNAELDITFETRAPADVDEIRAKLHAAQYTTSVLESTAKAAV